MPAAKKATPAAATPIEPAPDVDPVPAPTPDPETPAEPAPDAGASEGDDFCPEPGTCFPDGLADDVTHVGCVHGQWDLSAE
jgi:hypothetical protein